MSHGENVRVSRRRLILTASAAAVAANLPVRRVFAADTRPADPVPPQRITINPKFNEQLLYFTSTSLLEDDRRIVFISDRTGHPNLFMLDTGGGREVQLTANAEGFLKSYVYFDGRPYRGLGKASISLDAKNGRVYFIQGRQICAADMDGKQRVLAEYPADQMTAFTHVSADGKRLCVPTTDARSLDGDVQLSGKPAYDIDQRVREEKLNSYLRIYDTETGKLLSAEPFPGGWITHVQLSPTNSDVVLFNNEWPSDCGIRRIWLWDGKKHVQLRREGNGRSRADWTCHEVWERDGSAIVYHGTYAKGPSYIGRMNPDGSDPVEIALPAGWTRYGHFTNGRSGMLVTDGYWQRDDDPPKPGQGHWIVRLDLDWKARKIDWRPLCRHGSSWRSQDEHPHPIYNHAADAIYFTSDREGKRAVYRVAAT